MTLQIHRAERTDLLADELGRLLTKPLADPFAEEVVVVPARGVERWLTQRLSHRLGAGDRGGDGVCAGVRFLSPHSLVATLLSRERDDVWDPDRLVWPLLEVVDGAMGEPWCATLATHLGFGDDDDEASLRQARRYSVARRLSGLFASYAVQRPRLVAEWAEGADTDGAGHPLDADLVWQAELWRRLVKRVGEPAPDVRHRDTLERLRSGGDGLDLPPRMSLFGHTRLPVTEVELLAALGELREVHLWLPQVSATLWHALAASVAEGPVPREEDRSIEAVGHALLGSLGRDARELQRTLAVAGGPVVVEAVAAGPVSGPIGTRGEPGEEPGSLLGWLQHDLRANAEPDEQTRRSRRVAATDRSVQVHACHGAARQVDVLREVLTGLLEDDPTLEPRDILVMCPDIETYAPLVQAGFGLAGVADGGEGHPAHGLRVRLADRALSSINPLLTLAARLVELAGGRVRATDLLDLAAAEPVRRRFGFTDDDLAQLGLWIEQASIRWGLDGAHRGRYGLTLDEHTWAAGLGRVLLGVAMAEEGHRAVGGTLPVDDVPSGDIDLAGRFSEYVERVHAFVRAAGSAATIAQWTDALAGAVAQVTAVGPREAWQQAQFDRELARMHDSARDQAGPEVGDDSGGPGATRLRLADVRHLLAHRLRGRPTRSNFRTGTLTVCTMVPMRSVPHRVVCLVGLDDGVFPRTSTVDGDDVLARRPLTGERDGRSEDRQLFLDAILAARETLVITYTGANEHTGASRPPAVPLGELLDALELTATGRVREHVVTAHPLQPFDVRNLTPGELDATRPFSFDRSALAGARAARSERSPVTALVTSPLPEQPPADVALADLQAFFAHPVRAFLRSRLDVSSPQEAEEVEDAIPVGLDGLDRWKIGDHLLADVLTGSDLDSAVEAVRRRGLLPPGRLGDRALTEILEHVRPLGRGLETLRRDGRPRTLDVDVDLGQGRRLTGTVTSVFGNRLVRGSYSRLAPKHRLRAWVDLLALSAGLPDESWSAHTLGRGGRAGIARAQVGPLDHRAVDWLRELVDLYDRGMREPVPLPVKTACAWAEAHRDHLRGARDTPDWKAEREWRTDRYSRTGIPGEDADVAHVQVFGQDAPFSCLTGPARPGETWSDAPHRLGQFAWRLWQRLLDEESVGPL